MTGPPPGAGVAAEGFFRGRWVEEVEEDILSIGVWRKRNRPMWRLGDVVDTSPPASFRSLDFRLSVYAVQPVWAAEVALGAPSAFPSPTSFLLSREEAEKTRLKR